MLERRSRPSTNHERGRLAPRASTRAADPVKRFAAMQDDARVFDANDIAHRAAEKPARGAQLALNFG